MDKLNTLDAEFLHLEDGIGHMHIAGLSVFEGPPPAPGEFVALLEAKMHEIPRYRQRVRVVPLELGRPVWVDDPHFNLEYHVRQTALPAPGDDAVLCRLMGRLMSQPLDRNRPLWEDWIVEGLPDGRWALIFKVHHCMVDGIAGVQLLSAVLDAEPTVELSEPPPWEPAPEPSGAEMVLDAWRGVAGDVVHRVLGLPSTVAHPATALRSLAGTLAGAARLGQHLTSTPPLSIEGKIGPHRRWAHSSVSLDDVKAIRKAFGGTVNDIVLAAVSRGYRGLLAHHGDDPDRAVIRALIPVSVRRDDVIGVWDNRVSAVLLELPVNIEAPLERLEAVRRHMGELKGSHMAEVGEWVTQVGDLAPPMVVGTVSRLAVWVEHRRPQRSVNTVATNVPGPQFPLYLLGRQMLEYHPFVPLSHGVRVGTAILSYNGRLAFGVTGDYDTVPDVGVLAAGIVDGVDELRRLAGPPRRSGKKRRPAVPAGS
jgi:WS/DGAT/MGAT family acyltransferase